RFVLTPIPKPNTVSTNPATMEAAPPNSSFCPVRRVSPSLAGQGPPSTLQSLDTSAIVMAPVRYAMIPPPRRPIPTARRTRPSLEPKCHRLSFVEYVFIPFLDREPALQKVVG